MAPFAWVQRDTQELAVLPTAGYWRQTSAAIVHFVGAPKPWDYHHRRFHLLPNPRASSKRSLTMSAIRGDEISRIRQLDEADPNDRRARSP